MRRHWIAALAALCVFLVLSSAPRAQTGAPPRLSARLSSGIARLGQQVQLRVDLEGAQRAEIVELPRVDGLQVGPAGAPNISEYTVIANGRTRVSRTLTWLVPVQAAREGVYELGPVKLTADGKALQTSGFSLTVVKDMQGAELGFMEIKAVPEPALAGAPVRIELRFGWDEALSHETNYAQLSLPWWGELPGLLERNDQPVDARLERVQLPIAGFGSVPCEELRGEQARGKPFRMFRLRRDYIATRPGRVELPTSTLEFGRYRETRDFFNPRREIVAQYFVSAAELAIEIEPLPEAGRPAAFSGAVGAVRARARAEPRDVDAGDSIKLEVEWTGDANLEFFEPPDPLRLDAFKGFRVFGHTETDKSSSRRQVVYDLAPLSTDVQQIPALPLWVYDTDRRAYVEVSTEPLSIHVRPLRDASKLAALGKVEEYADDLADIATGLEPGVASSRGSTHPGAWLAGLGGIAAAWLIARALVRRSGDPAAP
ncbi:MAG: protein BatD, partial [Planctomycetes bacterium]|nr:protein BatD [Planctomycetota bacterium]